jgi:formate dehydrogenase iron-sulfur subunit
VHALRGSGLPQGLPGSGAIVQYSNGIVDVNPDQCIGCRLCETGCPFDVPRFSEKTGKMSKCTLCVDRTTVGLEPACVKACPTGCLHFGTKAHMIEQGKERVKQLKADGLTPPPRSTIRRALEAPESHGSQVRRQARALRLCPRTRPFPSRSGFVKSYLRPLGLIGIGAVVVGLGRPLPPGSARG